ncbi:riboflavin kinase [Metamycoplasma cloacale]|uniref:FAD synthase n=1 Tax=Metamycoplasma cloacale TaxID=92401 RepID=A0A2Z4LLY0_9BACT|nr:hypothetical protein [Metamycoplasma cloacale]AWX42782.1 riboflavin biosynthesis protein [Metamycoplasma cloacale]VEU79402.1 riboflavin kinase [Metamycoplasma cloacale]
MELYNLTFNNKIQNDQPLILCLGSFETLHIGHLELIKNAKSLKILHPECILAFSIFKNPHKNGNVKPEKAFQLKPRLYTLANYGFNQTYIIDFNEDFRYKTAKEFIELLKKMNVKHIVCGQDYTFGFNKSGNINLLKKYFDVSIASERKINSQKISSGIIRDLIKESNIEMLNTLLIDKYAFIVNVEKFHFQYPENLIRLHAGIYYVNVVIENIEYHGICLINFNQNNEMNNKLILLDLDLVWSKHQEVYIEFIDKLRLIKNQAENEIFDDDIAIAKAFFSINIK